MLEVAIGAAEDAGRKLLQLFRKSNLTIRRKYDYPGSIVTNADEEAEKLILSRIRKSRIKSTVKSEEAGTLNFGSDDIVWAVDPLDGTLNYVKRIPYFSVSIGMLIDRRPVGGVIYNPVLDEMFVAVRDEGARLNARKIHVSRTRSLKNSTLIFEWWQPEPSIPDPLDFEKKLYHFTRSIRSPGSAALNLCSVASGRFDGMVTVFQKSPIYETAAGSLMVQQAGGKITDSRGGSWESFSRSLVAGGERIHRQILSLLRPSRSNIGPLETYPRKVLY
jgi:myo-inositol-1(or 4)-monophosphatase